MSFKKMLVAAALCSTFAVHADTENFYVGGQYSKTTLKEKESGFSRSIFSFFGWNIIYVH